MASAAATKNGARVPSSPASPSDQRPGDEADPEAGADQAEVLGSPVGGADVGHVGVGGGVGGAGDAGQRTAGEQQPQRGGEAHDQVVHRQREEREQQHRPPTEAVRQVPERRAEGELHQRVDEAQVAAPQCGGPERQIGQLADQVGHDRHDDADAHGVDEHRHDDEGGGTAATGLTQHHQSARSIPSGCGVLVRPAPPCPCGCGAWAVVGALCERSALGSSGRTRACRTAGATLPAWAGIACGGRARAHSNHPRRGMIGRGCPGRLNITSPVRKCRYRCRPSGSFPSRCARR